MRVSSGGKIKIGFTTLTVLKNSLENQPLPTTRQSLLNTASIFFNRLIAIAATLIITPIITNHFGLELIGIWLVVNQLTSHLYLLDAGISSSLYRLLSRARALGNLEEANGVISSSFIILVVIGVVILLATPFCAELFIDIYEIEKNMTKEMYWLVVVSLLYVAITLPLRVGHGLLGSIHKFNTAQKWESQSIFIRLVLVLILFNVFDVGLLLLGIIFFLPHLMAMFFLFFDGLKANSDLKIGWQYMNKNATRDIASLSSASVINTSAAVLLMQGSSMLLGVLIGIQEVSYLAYPLLIVSMILPFLNFSSTLLSPVASQLASQNKKGQLEEIYYIASRYVFSLAIIVFIGVQFVGNEALRLWLVGEKVSEQDVFKIYLNLVIILGGVCLAIPAFVGRSILNSVGRHWVVARLELVAALLGLIVGAILVVWQELGVLGMVYGVLISFVLRGLIFLPFHVASYFEISLAKMMMRTLAGPMLIGLAVYLSGDLLLTYLNTRLVSTWPALGSIVVAVSCFTFWFLLNWHFIIEDGHKLIAKGYARRIINSVIDR